MDNDSEHDLEAVAARLRADRPELTPLELDALQTRLDALQTRIRSRTTTTRRGTFMKSRMAVTMMLVLGLLFSTAGAGLAIEGMSDSGNAGVAQYRQDTQPAPVLGDVAGEEATTTTPQRQPQGQAAPQSSPAQAPRQEAAQADEGELPFTGLAAIPVLAGGLVLLGSGLVLRRRTSGDRD